MEPGSPMLRRALGATVAAVVAGWLVYALTLDDVPAQDAIPLVVAGELAGDDADAVYLEEEDEARPLLARSCRFYADEQECLRFAVAYVSPPTALPLLVPVSGLSDESAVRLFRLAGVAALAAAMAVIWRLLDGGAAVIRGAAVALTAVLLTPLVVTALDLGQTSPLLFLAAAVAPSVATGRGRAIAAGLLLALAGAFKAFPLALAAVLAAERRWVAAVTAALATAALAVAALAIVPFRLWGDFLRAAGDANGEALTGYNGSIEGALADLGWSTASIVVWAGRALLAGGVVLALRRTGTADERWAIVWVGVLILLPQVWGHYAFVGVAAVAVLLASRAAEDRLALVLPAAAALTLPVAGVDAGGRPAVVFAANLAFLAIAAGLLLLSAPEPRRSVSVPVPAGAPSAR